GRAQACAYPIPACSASTRRCSTGSRPPPASVRAACAVAAAAAGPAGRHRLRKGFLPPWQISLIELPHFGQARDMNSDWDCVVVGGGAAGLSAGLVLGRARRRTLLVDAGQQSNLAAHGVGGLMGHDGRPPAELYETGRREIAAYPSVEVRTGEVVTGERAGDVFELELSDGRRERTRRV